MKCVLEARMLVALHFTSAENLINKYVYLCFHDSVQALEPEGCSNIQVCLGQARVRPVFLMELFTEFHFILKSIIV